MAELLFITETGMFHSACRVTFGINLPLNIESPRGIIGIPPKWYGFKPRKNLSPMGSGFVDHSDRSAFTNHSIAFYIEDVLMKAAIDNLTSEYSSKTYVVTVCDCVSFTADVARRCRLKVPLVNLTPFGFLEILGVWNKYIYKT